MRRLIGWLQRLNEVAFRGANELHDSNCSERLISDFAEFAQWDDDPADFHLAQDNIRWMDWRYYGDVKARIQVSPFNSEEYFLRWQLRQPLQKFDYDAQMNLLNVEKADRIIRRLEELGIDVGKDAQTADLVGSRLRAQRSELEEKLKSETNAVMRERLTKAIKKTNDQLLLC